MKNQLKKFARKVLKDDFYELCEDNIKINCAAVDAREKLLTVLANKKATKAQMTEAMNEAVKALEAGLDI